MKNNETEGSIRTALTAGRKLARREFARVLRMVHRAQQPLNFDYGSREAKAIGGMYGYTVLVKRLHVIDGVTALTVSVSVWN